MSADPVALNRAERRQVARVAARPPARTVTVTIEGGDFDGWSATARADFPTWMLEDMESGKIAPLLALLEVIVTDHNMPNADGELAEHLRDVDPYDGLLKVAGAIMDRIQKLPNR